MNNNLRFFKPSSETQNDVFIKVMTTSNTVKSIVLDKVNMVSRNSIQVCFDKEFLEKEIIKQITSHSSCYPVYAFGIKNLNF